MSYEKLGGERLDYQSCSYGSSKLSFRGPYRVPQAISVAVLGGSDTYGKFIPDPYPRLLEFAIKRPVVNLGCMHASADAFLGDPVLDEVCARADAVVVQIMGAQNLSNSFYKVHPRRNDRFLRATDKLRQLFPEVDFTQFNFTRHLLATLRGRAPERFDVIIRDLQAVWVQRMQVLLAQIAPPTTLLWISPQTSAQVGQATSPNACDPLFVTAQMVERVRPYANSYVEVAASPSHMPTRGMLFSELELEAAQSVANVEAHTRAAQALAREVPYLIQPTKKPA